MYQLKLASKIMLIMLGTVFALVIALSPIASADPTIHYAKPGGATTGTCNSWLNACDLPYALTTAISGTEIWIARGVYTPGLPITSSFQLKSGVALYGGFALTETARNQRNWQTNLTVLSGDIDGNDTTDANGVVTDTANLNGTNAYHVLVATNTAVTAILDGLIVTAGNANGDGVTDPSYNGGGLYSSQANLVVRNVTFSGNRAAGDGGGWFVAYGGPTLDNVLFTKNKSGNGGGGLCVRGDTHTTLNQVTFSGNQSTRGGGMLFTSSTSGHLSLTNVAFLGNSATSESYYTYGGGLWLESVNASATLNNLLFSGNWSKWYAGAMYLHGEAAMTNFTFSGNRANDSGGALYLLAGQHTLVNFILWGNSAPNGSQIHNGGGSPLSIIYSDVQGGYTGAGNLNVDPQFVAPITATVAPTTTGDYRLQITSPAIDAGNSLSVTVSTDLDGHPRKIDVPAVLDTGLGTPPIVDMGAYEASWPVADAGSHQAIKGGTLVTLDGSGSTDPAGNLPLTYGWTQTGGVPVVLSSAVISRPTFSAPTLTSQILLTFTLVVTNSIGQVSAPDLITITVLSPDIVVAPQAFTVTLARNLTVTHVLTITNQGDAALTWTLSETPTVSWLDEASYGGAIGPNTTALIAITFDTTGLTSGVYTTTLRLVSDDPDQPQIDLPVTLSVPYQLYLPLITKTIDA